MMKSEASINAAAEPWYRSSMLWLAMSLPLLTVIAGIATYRLAAAGAGAADAEPEAVLRVAQMQTTDLASDEMALQLGLSAEAHIDVAAGVTRKALPIILTVHISAWADAAVLDYDFLQLRLAHRTQAKFDRTVMLRRDASGRWRGLLPADLYGGYNAVLAPPDSRWRLIGTIDAASTLMKLGPMLGGDDD